MKTKISKAVDQKRLEAKAAKLQKKHEKIAAREAKRAEKEAAKASGLPKVLIGKSNPDQLNIKTAFIKLSDPDRLHLEALRDSFTILIDVGVCKRALFSRTTGAPKVKKVLTKQGRELMKHLFPKQQAEGGADTHA